MEGRKRDAIRQRLTEMLAMERQIADGLARRIGDLRADRETARGEIWRADGVAEGSIPMAQRT